MWHRVRQRTSSTAASRQEMWESGRATRSFDNGIRPGLLTQASNLPIWDVGPDPELDGPSVWLATLRA